MRTSDETTEQGRRANSHSLLAYRPFRSGISTSCGDGSVCVYGAASVVNEIGHTISLSMTNKPQSFLNVQIGMP